MDTPLPARKSSLIIEHLAEIRRKIADLCRLQWVMNEMAAR
jgi:hypothetical protein